MHKKNIPAIVVVGMFFFRFAASATPLDFAEDLFRKGEWELCARECRRAELDGETPLPRFRLLGAMSAIRTGAPTGETMPALAAVIKESDDREVKSIASYELGRLQWGMEQPDSAFDSFAFAFHSTTNKELFLHSACSLFLLMKDEPRLKKNREELASQITTSRDQWYGALFSKCGKPDLAAREDDSPGWFIGFYRSQISPAIGNRCSLYPSCSEYFVQASRKHGVLALPMIADRFIREPEASNRRQYPYILDDGRTLYRDPVEFHDFWLNR